MKNFLCFLGLHDWKILKIDNYAQIEENLRVEIERKTCKCSKPCFCHLPMQIILSGFLFFKKEYYEIKVCTRCEKYVDEISPYKNKIRQKVIRDIELENKYGTKD